MGAPALNPQFCPLVILTLCCLCLAHAQGNKFCKGGKNNDEHHCSEGCKFGLVTGDKVGSKVCHKDILHLGLRKCKDQSLKQQINDSYSQSMTCTKCKQNWSGDYCMQGIIQQEKNITAGESLDETTIQIRNQWAAAIIDFHKPKGLSWEMLQHCAVNGCNWTSEASSGVRRMKCRTAEKSRNLTIFCPQLNGEIYLLKVNVYVCVRFWYSPQTGCNKHCNCQDGAECDPWTGQCPDGKEIALTATSSTDPEPPKTTPTIQTTVKKSSKGVTTVRDGVVTDRTQAGQSDAYSSRTTEGDIQAGRSIPGASLTAPNRTDLTQTATAVSTTQRATSPPAIATDKVSSVLTVKPSTAKERSTLTTIVSTQGLLSTSTGRVITSYSSSISSPKTSPPTTVKPTYITAEIEDDKSEATTIVSTQRLLPTSTGRIIPSYSSSISSPKTLPPTTVKPTYTIAGTEDDKSEDMDDDNDEEDREASSRKQQANQRVSDRDSGGDAEDDVSMMVVWGAVAAMVVLMAVAVLAVVIYKKRYGGNEKKVAPEESPCVLNMEMNDVALTPQSDVDESENVYVNTSVAFTVTTEPIAIDAFSNHLHHMKRLCGYSREYQELPNDIQGPVTAAEEANCGLVKKNRFKDILPYDETRVVLKKEKESDSDYINANYIDGFAEAVAYIAAQGPLPETVGDFWHMIWTEGCSKIVMLNNLVEEGKIRCERYWPESEGSSQTFGPYTITNVRIVHKAHFVLRCLSVAKQAYKATAAEASREVQQFHFTAWPDHGVPCPVALVQFWSSVILHPVKLGGPMLVHCSAGIGRTGTFIALDMLTHQAETTGKVSVFPTVRRLRKQRINMVQTLSQYKFLHEVVQEWLCARDADMVKGDLMHGSRWKGEDGASPTILPPVIRQMCATQFKLLSEMRPEVSSVDITTASKEENTAKNRFPHILPVEQFRVCLATNNDNDNDYINAVFLPSVSSQQGYVVTQLPLPHTVNDFWAMVRDWRVNTIVCFRDAPKDQEVSLFADPGQRVQHGLVSIHTVNMAAVIPGLAVYTLHLSTQETPSSGSGSQEVKVYCVESQQALNLEGSSVFVSLASTLLPLLTTDQPPIVMQCFDGAGLSCVLCAVMMGLEALKVEERTNPFLLARLIHTARLQAFTTPEQYEFMVRCLVHYTQGITDNGGDSQPTVESVQGSQSDPIYTNVENTDQHIYDNV